jgi:hypothetical protein
MAATVSDLGARVLRRLGIAAVAASDRPGQSAPVTVETVAREALQWLGVIAADETPAPADASLAQEKVRHIADSLIAQGLVGWSADAIPAAVAEEVVRLVAMHLAPAYGKTTDPAQLEAIEGRIRRVSLIVGAPQIAEQAVMDVHANLDARGKTRWTVWDLPDFVEGPYIMMAANLVAPQFGLPADPAADVRAMRELAQVTALPSEGEPVRAVYF